MKIEMKKSIKQLLKMSMKIEMKKSIEIIKLINM